MLDFSNKVFNEPWKKDFYELKGAIKEQTIFRNGSKIAMHQFSEDGMLVSRIDYAPDTGIPTNKTMVSKEDKTIKISHYVVQGDKETLTSYSTYLHDKSDRLTTITSFLSNTKNTITRFIYNKNNVVIRENTYYKGKIINYTLFDYDNKNQMISRIDYECKAGKNCDSIQIAKYKRNEKGLLTEMQFSADLTGFVPTTTYYFYDEQDRITLAKTKNNSSDEFISQMTYSYGERSKQTVLQNIENGVALPRYQSDFVLDEKGNCTQQTNVERSGISIYGYVLEYFE